ncbi:hypothetical protein KI387_008435, partial [Taxus chinensis]
MQLKLDAIEKHCGKNLKGLGRLLQQINSLRAQLRGDTVRIYGWKISNVCWLCDKLDTKNQNPLGLALVAGFSGQNLPLVDFLELWVKALAGYMERGRVLLMLFLLVLCPWEGMVPTASAAPPGRLISSSSSPAKSYAKYADIVLNPKELKGFVSDAFAALLKWIWAFPASTKSGRAVLQFESGYTVETVFDGSKHGIEPYSIQVSPDGDLLVLDSENSNILRVTPPLSRYSRAKLLAGSADGFSGYVDGKPREARLNHPKGFTVDDKGNVYVADTMNMAIRKIGDAGVTTIAGGRSSKPGHIDGPSEDAKFSNDFDVVYVGSTCSLLVVDRGNQAIREIQLNYNDCAYQYGSNFSSGVLIIGGAALMGYVLALIQQGVITTIFSQRENQDKYANSKKLPGSAKAGDRPSLIPDDGDQEN